MKLRGFEIIPWVLTFGAIALFILATVARGEDARTLTERRAAEVERGELLKTDVPVDLSRSQREKLVMKAGRPVDRNTL